MTDRLNTGVKALLMPQLLITFHHLTEVTFNSSHACDSFGSRSLQPRVLQDQPPPPCLLRAPEAREERVAGRGPSERPLITRGSTCKHLESHKCCQHSGPEPSALSPSTLPGRPLAYQGHPVVVPTLASPSFRVQLEARRPADALPLGKLDTHEAFPGQAQSHEANAKRE